MSDTKGARSTPNVWDWHKRCKNLNIEKGARFTKRCKIDKKGSVDTEGVTLTQCKFHLTQQNQSWPMSKKLNFLLKHSCIDKFGLNQFRNDYLGFQNFQKSFKVDKCTKSWNFNDITAVSTNWAQIGFRTDGIDMYGYTGVK